MNRLAQRSFVLLIYAVFIGTAGVYLRGFFKYRGVESWPSVAANIEGHGGDVEKVNFETRVGPGSTTFDSRFVEFSYSVEGQDYRSKKASPDGGGFPLNPLNAPWQAYYKPGSPEVAVLSPVPYRGTGWLVAAGFSGVLVLAHLFFTLPSIFSPRRRGRGGNFL